MVDLAALAANYQHFVQASRGGSVAAVVKANAYGLGAAPVAVSLWAHGCRDFFVATCDEGVTLRHELPTARIFVFEGARAESAAALAGARLIPVLNHAGQRHCWRPYRDLPCAVHVDTGMCRLGFDQPVAATDFAGFNVALLLTHLACADDPPHPLNAIQLDRFQEVARHFPSVPTSIGNSAGWLAGAAFQGDLGRPGIGLYGGNPFLSDANPMCPVASLRGEILQRRRVSAGTSIGYGATTVTARDTELAVIGVGYADGLPRLLSGSGEVAVGGSRCPIIGRISMDLTIVDVTGTTAAVGDWVEFFGQVVTVDEVAGWAQTLAYEVLTGLGGRLQRQYLHP